MKRKKYYFTTKTDRQWGVIWKLIRKIIRARRGRPFTRMDFEPSLTSQQARDNLQCMHGRGELAIHKRALRGQYGYPTVYRVSKKGLAKNGR